MWKLKTRINSNPLFYVLFYAYKHVCYTIRKKIVNNTSQSYNTYCNNRHFPRFFSGQPYQKNIAVVFCRNHSSVVNFQCLNDLIGVSFCIHFFEYLLNDSFLVDYKGCTQ